MNDIKSFVLQQFKDTFPDFNWRIGSTVRELLVEPLAYLSELFDTYINYLNNLNNINYVLDNPDICAAEIDTWMRQLNIQTPQQTAGSGTVSILVSSADDFVIPRGTVFVWGDSVNVFVEQDHKFSISDGTLQSVCYGCYKLTVAVITLQNTSVSLSSGAPLVWSNAPDTVLDIYVESPITGGLGELSYTGRADLIRSVLNAPAPCGERNILAGLQRSFPEVVADMMTLKTASGGAAGEVAAVLKQRAVPVSGSWQTHVESMDDSRMVVKVPSARLLYVQEVTRLTGERLAYEVVHDSQDGEYITLEILTGDPTSVCIGEAVVVKTLQASDSAKCFDWLNSMQVGSPYKFVESIPAIALIELEISAQGRKNLTETELLEIQEYINHSKINQTITDGGVSAILQAQKRTLTRPITYRGTVYYRGKARSFCSSGGMLNLSNIGVFSGVPVVAYTTIDKIKVV